MAANDIPCLIDWNSPVIEYSCKPLIPLPDLNGQVQINGDNPFDAVEMQTNENQPFDFVLNKSLNSSLEQAEFDKIVEMKNNERKTPEDLIEVFKQVNLDVEQSGICTPSHEYQNSVNTSALDLSPIESSDSLYIKERKQFLSSFIERLSSDTCDTTPVAKCSSENTFCGEKIVTRTSNLMKSVINKGFIENSETNFVKDFDSLMCNTGNLGEDLSTIVPVWDELGMISSSSDEEGEMLFMKSRSLEGINMKIKKIKDKVISKTNVRPPLGVKDPNIRAKKPVKAVKEEGPLKAVIPIENMTRNVNGNRKIGNGFSNISNRFSKQLVADSTSLKMKRRSAPIATSTPTITRDPKASVNKSKIGQRIRSSPSNRSCPPSPDSTSACKSRLVNNTLMKGCSRKLALSLVSSSTNVTYPSNIKKTSKDVRSGSMNSSMKSTATGVKSYVKNKENIVPFRY